MTNLSSGVFELEWAVGGAPTAMPLERVIIHSIDELNGALDRLQDQAIASGPFFAELLAPDGASLGIGLGLEGTVLVFKAGSSLPPYYESQTRNRDRDADDEDDVAFMYQGHLTEFSTNSLVAMEVGRQAMDEFFVTGALPGGVTWSEV